MQVMCELRRFMLSFALSSLRFCVVGLDRKLPLFVGVGGGQECTGEAQEC